MFVMITLLAEMLIFTSASKKSNEEIMRSQGIDQILIPCNKCNHQHPHLIEGLKDTAPAVIHSQRIKFLKKDNLKIPLFPLPCIQIVSRDINSNDLP